MLIQLELSEPVSEPLSFAIDNPARLALDFANVELNITRKTQNIGVGMARSVAAVEAAGRTRVVLNLVKLVPYELQVDGSNVFITLEGPGAMSAAAFQEGRCLRRAMATSSSRTSTSGAARAAKDACSSHSVDPSIVVDTREDGDRVIIDFFASGISGRADATPGRQSTSPPPCKSSIPSGKATTCAWSSRPAANST